jgi:hypothetical protein
MKACTATVTCPKCRQQFNAKFDAVPPEVLQRLQQQQAAASSGAPAGPGAPAGLGAPAQCAGERQPASPGASAQCAGERPPAPQGSETRAIHLGGSGAAGPIAQLVESRGLFSRALRHTLHEGDNTIGRADTDQPSDIQLKDNSVSRRSATIHVSRSPEGLLYRIAVNKATNPVIINGKPVHEGEAIFLKKGDTLQMGKTKLKLE